MPEHRALGWLSWPLPVDEAIVLSGKGSSEPYRGLRCRQICERNAEVLAVNLRILQLNVLRLRIA